MARPTVKDKMKQIPVSLRQSLIEKIGKDQLIKDIKLYIKTKYNGTPQGEHMPR